MVSKRTKSPTQMKIDAQDKRTTEIMMMLDDVEDRPLKGWWLEFVTSIKDQFDRRGTLTDTQYEKLKELYERP